MRPGANIENGGVRFSVDSASAHAIWLCLFDGEAETRIAMEKSGDAFTAFVPGIGEGARYGYRADGPFDPDRGRWFDPAKLLMDPHATRIDGPWRHDPRLALPREAAFDTAPLVPKAIVERLLPVGRCPAMFRRGGLIYEINVRAFSMLHPDVPASDRGTLAALRHPTVIDHLRRLCVDAVELMPVTAWIDERHLPPLGLGNAWGYNPVTFMALEPRLAPGGIADLAMTVEALHAAGIGVILDLVFNHTGESDRHGATLSFRGLDNGVFYRHDPSEPGLLVNDTGCGNTIACDHPRVRGMILDTLRHFVRHTGVDGFRFDLAPIMGRTTDGFDPGAETLRMIVADEWLADRVLIAEPWDIGPGGYALGRFGEPWLEWNDRCRDDIRRFWRGDGRAGDLATRLAGSFDIFAGDETRSVNFVACHDGFMLADLTAYRNKHNEANREGNRDGHDENFSWNHGVEGATHDQNIVAARIGDIKAMLATLFASRGTIMLAAGDEFGRTQGGNNNAYAQDNETVWIDWLNRNLELEAFTASLASLRRRFAVLGDTVRLTGMPGEDGIADVEWLGTDGAPLSARDWDNPALGCFAMVLATGEKSAQRIAFAFNRTGAPLRFHLRPSPQMEWLSWDKAATFVETPPRSVSIVIEQAANAR